MKLEKGDYLYKIGKSSDHFSKVKVKSTTAKYAVLDNKVKIEREGDKYFSTVPKKKESKFYYVVPTMELDNRYDYLNKNALQKFMVWTTKFNAERFFGANTVALVFSVFLLIAQTFHTAHSLIELGSALGWAKYPFGIMSGIFLDGLILFFLSNGSKFASWVSMACCFFLNAYSYHLDYDWFTYNSYFSIIPSIFVPYSLHAVGHTIIKKKHNVKQ